MERALPAEGDVANPWLLNAAALADLQRLRYPAAVRRLRRAVSLAPGDPVLRGNLGQALYWAGQTDDARAELLRARELGLHSNAVDDLLRQTGDRTVRRCLWLLFPLALAACAAIPRDDNGAHAARPERAPGRAVGAGGQPAGSPCRRGRPYLLPLAECRYRQNDEDGARALLGDVNHPAAQNVLAALDAELSRETGGSERLTFLQFVRRVAMRYDMDAELLLAFMRQESSFRAKPSRGWGPRGSCSSLPATARALGLTVPQENIVKSPPIRSAALDERFHPAKNVEAAANHLRFLLNHYRTDDATPTSPRPLPPISPARVTCATKYPPTRGTTWTR
jgi:tetratricopeptide (TPR) repeat protein